MDPFLSTLLLILLALLGARFSFSTGRVPAGPRLLFRTGTHFLFLGLILGPRALGLFTEPVVEELFPLLGLALGWIGFLFGLQLDRRHLSRFPPAYLLLALGQAAIAFLIFLAVGWGTLRGVGLDTRIVSPLVMGAAATACVSTPAGVALISATFRVRGVVRDLLFFVASLDALMGIAALQATYALFPAGEAAGLSGGPGDLTWMIAALGLGIVCGIVFLWLIRPRPGQEELVLFLLGIAAFASGAALQLRLSPLFVSVTMGAVVANLSSDPGRIYRILQEWEKPIYVVLLLLSGALLSFPTVWVLPLAAGYALLRAGAKLAGNYLMLKALPFSFAVPRRLGLALLPQGGISLAMAVSWVLTYGGTRSATAGSAGLLFAVVVLGVVLSELAGPLFTRAVLESAGEITPEEAQAGGSGGQEGARWAEGRADG